MVFCQEDRAILCRECDDSIHKANEHTQKHNRFLLSGVKLSPLEASFSYQTSTSSNTSSYNYMNAGTSESGTEINRSSIHDDRSASACRGCCLLILITCLFKLEAKHLKVRENKIFCPLIIGSFLKLLSN